MALRIFWSKRAETNFEKITAYLQESFGDEVTEKFVKKVYSFLYVLSQNPEIGKLQQVGNLRGFVIVKQVTIFYEVHDKGIVLLNFFTNLQNPLKKF